MKVAACILGTLAAAGSAAAATECASACPGSPLPDGTFASCQVTVKFESTCADVQKEVEARMAGDDGWVDPKSNPGTYALASSTPVDADGGCTYGTRQTGDGMYTDKFGLTYAVTGGAGEDCAVTACSDSQVSSKCDYSTNFCNTYNLYCGEAEGCQVVATDLAGTQATSDCDHGAVCGGDEDLPAQCTR